MTDNTAVVTFDVAAFRTWLDTTGAAATDPYLSKGFNHIDGGAGWLTAAALLAVTTAENAGWSTVEGVSITAHVLADAEGGEDAGVYLDVLVDGQRLGFFAFRPKDLIQVDEDESLPGYEAAILALESVAHAVNERVAYYRSSMYGFYARQLNREEIETALVTLAEYHDHRGCPDLTGLQKEVTAKVADLTRDNEADSAEIEDNR